MLKNEEPARGLFFLRAPDSMARRPRFTSFGVPLVDVDYLVEKAFDIINSRWGALILVGVVVFGYNMLRSGNNPRP
jgi:hypothetical protein